MNSDAERASDRAGAVADRHDDRAVDAGLLRARPDVPARVGLDVARRDRGISLGREAGHALSDRNPLHDFDDGRRQAHLPLQDENAIFHEMERPRIRPKPFERSARAAPARSGSVSTRRTLLVPSSP
jgi:hypothetical protein